MTPEEVMSRCYEHGQPDYVLAGDTIKALLGSRAVAQGPLSPPEVVAAVQQAIMKHPFWKPGLGSSAFAFGLANTAISAYAQQTLDLPKVMLNDAFEAVTAIWGTEGLEQVAEHMQIASRARRSNDDRDALESALRAPEPSMAWAEYDAWNDFCEKTEPENRTMQGACEFGYAAGKAFVAAIRTPEAKGEMVAWHCIYPTHGHITLKGHEAVQASLDGAEVHAMVYASPADAGIAATPAMTPIDRNFLSAIRKRLVQLYDAEPNDARLREQLSDECDWIDAALSAAQPASADAVRALPDDPDMPNLRLCSFNYLADEMRRRGATVTPAPHGGDFCNG